MEIDFYNNVLIAEVHRKNSKVYEFLSPLNGKDSFTLAMLKSKLKSCASYLDVLENSTLPQR